MAQQVLMPRLSQDMLQGRVVEWLKRAGEAIAEGEPLVVVETDKSEVEIPAPRSGTLWRVLVAVGDEVDVGSPLAIVAEPGESLEKLQATPDQPVGIPSAQAAGEPPPVPIGSGVPPVTGRPEPGSTVQRQPVSPAARRAAREQSVEISSVQGTGPGGLVTESDVRSFAAVRSSTVTSEIDRDVEVVPLTAMRRRIAERLALSRQTAVDVTTVTDVEMTEIATLRRTTGLPYTAYVLRATADALREFPILNASLQGDEILIKHNIDLGVAVATDQGLVVPVIRSADAKSVAEMAHELDQLAVRAREGHLGAEQLTGSTFTVTNSGAFGSLLFTPIINQPEVAILGMGKVADTPVVRNGEVVVGKVMFLCLTYDHRVVDGAPAVQFLQAVKHRLEHPETSLMQP